MKPQTLDVLLDLDKFPSWAASVLSFLSIWSLAAVALAPISGFIPQSPVLASEPQNLGWKTRPPILQRSRQPRHREISSHAVHFAKPSLLTSADTSL